MNPLKAALLACFSLFLCFAAYAQSGSQAISITQIALQPVMPGDLTKWPGIPNGLTLSARTDPKHGEVQPRLMVRIKSSGGILCDITASTKAAMAPFSSKTFSASELLTGASNCEKLPEGNYEICFQFIDAANEALSTEECRPFSVGTTKQNISYSAPANVLPKDNQLFVGEEARSSIRFEWRGVAPSPEENVTYRLKIWQLKDGQSQAQAIATNQPVLTKDVIGATSITIENGLPAPCAPHNTCKYAWNVQALDAKGNSIGSSLPTALTAADYIIRIKNIQVSCTATPGVYSFTYQVENPNPSTAKLTNLVVTTSTPSGASITSFSPPLNTNIVSGGNVIITGSISASPSLSFICIGAEITDLVNSFWKASRDTCIPVPPCKCDACDPKKVGIEINPTNNVTINSNNTLSFSQPIAISTTPLKLVKNVEAQLIYFEYLPENEKCPACDSVTENFGNLYSGLLASEWAAGTGTHSLDWIYSPAVNFTSTQNAVITLSIPPTAGCCVRLRWCIRYVITFNDCTVCSKIVCYEKKKVGCSNGNPDHNPN